MVSSPISAPHHWKLSLSHARSSNIPCTCMLSGSVVPALCDAVDCSLPGSSVHRVLQARILEWFAASFSTSDMVGCVCSVTHLCPTLCSPMDCTPPASSVHGIVGKNIGMGCHFLLQGIFPTQAWNPRLLCPLHWQAYSLPPVPLGNPNIVIQVKSRLPFDCLEVSA